MSWYKNPLDGDAPFAFASSFGAGLSCTTSPPVATARSSPRGWSRSMSMGNMWPDRKNENSIYTNRSEAISPNQNPTSPMHASRKKPSTNDSTTDTMNTNHVEASGNG